MLLKELRAMGLSGLYLRTVDEVLGKRPPPPGGIADKLREQLRSVAARDRFGVIWRGWGMTVSEFASGAPVAPSAITDALDGIELMALSLSATAAEIRATLEFTTDAESQS